MATVTVNDLITRAQVILQDTASIGVRWPRDELINWLNDSYREIVLARPDANSTSGTYTCATGTRQKIGVTTAFPTALRLLDVVRNVSTTAGVANRAVRLIDRAILDDQRPLWHTEPSAAVIEHYMFDPRLPLEFLVYPPAAATAKLEVVYSSVPEAHATNLSATSKETIRLVDSYANVMLDYILYRAYSKDAEYAANSQRALNHYQAMAAALGIKTQADMSYDPRYSGGPPPQEGRGRVQMQPPMK